MHICVTLPRRVNCNRYFTHRGRMTHIYVTEVNHHWLVCSMLIHYLNQRWIIVNWTTGNKIQWKFNQTGKIFVQFPSASMCWSTLSNLWKVVRGPLSLWYPSQSSGKCGTGDRFTKTWAHFRKNAHFCVSLHFEFVSSLLKSVEPFHQGAHFWQDSARLTDLEKSVRTLIGHRTQYYTITGTLT